MGKRCCKVLAENGMVDRAGVRRADTAVRTQFVALHHVLRKNDEIVEFSEE